MNDAPRAPEVSVVIAVYNERGTIEELLRRVQDVDIDKEIVVVDDGSTDGTREVLQRVRAANVTVLFQPENRGKGAALRTALAEARGRYTTVLDADLEYMPYDIPALVEPLRNGEAQAVFGTRGFQSHSAYSFWYVVGNRAVTFAANLIYNS